MDKAKIRSFQDLKMWQKAKDFAVLTYKLTDAFPREELYGITSQLRRASVSVASNIAEGFRRRSTKDKIQFLRIAYGSGAEAETQLIIARELSYLKEEEYIKAVAALEEVMKMVNVVANKL